MINDELDNGSFLVNITNDDPSEFKTSDFEKRTEQLRLKATKRTQPNVDLKFNENRGYYELKFKKLIELFYFQDDGRTQQSKLKMNAETIMIYPSGALKNPLSFIVFGDLSYRGVYQMLPSNYQPQN